MILSIGEVLWDSMPAGLFLGGASLNVAYHLNALGHETRLVSRVGKDVLGDEILRRLRRLKIPLEGIGVSIVLPTGLVKVDLDASGSPAFEIVRPAAWDDIEETEALSDWISTARGIVFGTLAQRSPGSRAAIRRSWSSKGFKCCDVNLRPPHDDPRIVLESLEAADIVKMNHDELARIAGWSGIPAPALSAKSDRRARERELMERLSERYSIETLCITRGAEGAALCHAGKHYEHGGHAVKVVDTVGAGDALLAGFLDQTLAGSSPEKRLAWANLCGAFVAGSAGATPPMDRGVLEEFGRSPLLER